MRYAFPLCFAILFTGTAAFASDFDLDDEPVKKAPVVATIKARTFNLRECLALADRNHPNLWAARARVALAHAQLDEARWSPFWNFGAGFGAGALPPIGGTPFYNNSPAYLRNPSFLEGWQPAFQIQIGGAIPIYTFGKIDATNRAATANVRVQEWDAERLRVQVRADVRRAYFGLKVARDGKYLIDEVIDKLDGYIGKIDKKLSENDKSFDEPDRIRLQILRDETLARKGDALRNENYALAALRFMTGVQTQFEIPDTPIERPTQIVGPVVTYLTAARIMRPEVNQARAGIVARKAWLDFQRARLFPDFGLRLNAVYAIAPSATIQNTAWIGDGLNNGGTLGYGFIAGFQWSLDLLPQQARIAQAESQLEEVRALSRLALGGVAVEVENQYGIVLETKNREEAWTRIEHRAKGWLSMVSDRIDLGTADERALGEPLRNYMNARANHIIALMDYNVALSELARITGWDAVAPYSDER